MRIKVRHTANGWRRVHFGFCESDATLTSVEHRGRLFFKPHEWEAFKAALPYLPMKYRIIDDNDP